MKPLPFFELKHRDGRYVAPARAGKLTYTRNRKRAAWFLTATTAHECRLSLATPDAWEVIEAKE